MLFNGHTVLRVADALFSYARLTFGVPAGTRSA